MVLYETDSELSITEPELPLEEEVNKEESPLYESTLAGWFLWTWSNNGNREVRKEGVRHKYYDCSHPGCSAKMTVDYPVTCKVPDQQTPKTVINRRFPLGHQHHNHSQPARTRLEPGIKNKVKASMAAGENPKKIQGPAEGQTRGSSCSHGCKLLRCENSTG